MEETPWRRLSKARCDSSLSGDSNTVERSAGCRPTASQCPAASRSATHVLVLRNVRPFCMTAGPGCPGLRRDVGGLAQGVVGTEAPHYPTPWWHAVVALGLISSVAARRRDADSKLAG